MGVRCVEVTGQVWAVFPFGKYKDVDAGGGVSVGVCTVYGLFEGLFESVWCVFWYREGCAWPGSVSVGSSAKSVIFGVM